MKALSFTTPMLWPTLIFVCECGQTANEVTDKQKGQIIHTPNLSMHGHKNALHFHEALRKSCCRYFRQGQIKSLRFLSPLHYTQ